MLDLLKIAVTGPISSGKSTVCEIMSKHKAFVISADDIVHRLLKSNITVQNQVNQLLNNQINFSDPDYRKLIANKIFNDSNLLQEFEKLLHPLVIREIKEAYEACLKSKNYRFFVCEVPLLFEIGFETFFDKTIYVDASESTCVHRFCQKKPTQEKNEWFLRMKRFLPKNDAVSKANYIIKNDCSIPELNNQITDILQSLL